MPCTITGSQWMRSTDVPALHPARRKIKGDSLVLVLCKKSTQQLAVLHLIRGFLGEEQSRIPCSIAMCEKFWTKHFPSRLQNRQTFLTFARTCFEGAEERLPQSFFLFRSLLFLNSSDVFQHILSPGCRRTAG